jgi:hypothetical protein
MTRINRISREVAKLTDSLGHPMDGGIVKTVVGLRVHGVETAQSCEGHLGKVNNEPYVLIRGKRVDEIEEKHTKTYKKIVAKMPTSGQPQWTPQQRQELVKLGGLSTLLEQRVKPQQRRVTDLADEFNQQRSDGSNLIVRPSTPGRISLTVRVPTVSVEDDAAVLVKKQGVMDAFGDFLLGKKKST